MIADRSRNRLVRPTALVALALIAAALIWAPLRGLHLYGLTPVNLAYDLDQPPVLVALVGGWLLYRSRRR